MNSAGMECGREIISQNLPAIANYLVCHPESVYGKQFADAFSALKAGAMR